MAPPSNPDSLRSLGLQQPQMDQTLSGGGSILEPRDSSCDSCHQMTSPESPQQTKPIASRQHPTTR